LPGVCYQLIKGNYCEYTRNSDKGSCAAGRRNLLSCGLRIRAMASMEKLNEYGWYGRPKNG